MYSDDTYRTIAANSSWVYKEKSSKFLAIAIPVTSEIAVLDELKVIKKEYHNANHYCFGYRLGYNKELFRYNDDGEPSGTAGKPIYGQLVSFDLTNILLVVVRYFGGTKLGVSGLINAYKTAAREVLKNSEIITRTVNDVFDLKFEYININAVMRVLKERDIKPLESNYEHMCSIRISIRKSISDQVVDKLKKINSLTYNQIQVI